jgi:phage shock protein PspC (stress-responsive transcriptional regulator)
MTEPSAGSTGSTADAPPSGGPTDTPPPGATPPGGAAGAPPPPGGGAPPPPPFQLPATLVRPAHDRVFRGVCAAIGRATGTDPVLWRVLVVVLTFFGGTGLVLYLAGWLLIPEEGSPDSEVQRLVHGQGASTGAVVALAVLGVLALLIVFDDGRGIVPLAVVGVLAYLVVRNRNATGAPPGSGGAVPPPPTGAAAWDAPPAWTAPAGPPPAWGPPPTGLAYGPPAPPPPPAPRSRLGALTVSVAAVVVGLMVLASALGVGGITAPRVVAAALLVTGLGLLVGARWGRARGLIALAIVLALALGALTSVDRSFGSGAGERTWVVDGSADHRLGAGTATLDLRELAGTNRKDLTVRGRVGAGELVVLVPKDLRVRLDAKVGLGELTAPEGTRTRTDSGPGLSRATDFGPPGNRNVTLELRVGLGEVEVRRVEAQ